MEFSQEKYKYLYLIKEIKRNLERGDQSRIAEKMGSKSTAISGIVNGSRTTSIEVIKDIVTTMNTLGIYNKTFKQLEQEATKEAYKYKYGEDLETTSSNIDNLTDKEILEQVVFKRSGHNVSETDLDVIMGVINSFKK